MNANSAHILVIDDDPDIQTVVEMILEPMGYTVSYARTGAAGLEAMRRSRPDLVLLDIMLMQPMEGLQIACQMRQDPRLDRIPIIFISAVAEALSSDYAKEVCPVALAADMFLEKPLDATSLREAVEWVLAQQQSAPAPCPNDHQPDPPR